MGVLYETYDDYAREAATELRDRGLKVGVYGEAQVCGEAQVYGKAQVYGEAQVCGEAQVYGKAKRR